MDPYNHSTLISIKLPILDTGKFKQWKFRIQQYLQHKYYAIWEVIEFSYSYKDPPKETAKDKGLAGEVSSSTKKKGRTVAIPAEYMQKRKNDVKARTTLLLALPDELRFSKYDSAKELWEAILKTFSGNEATKKTKKNRLKQMASTIVWRNRDDLDTMSLDDVYNNLKVHKTEPNGSKIKYEDIFEIDDDDIEDMDIKCNLALLSMRADRFWKKTESADYQGVKTEQRERATRRILRVLERDKELKDNKIEYLRNELEEVKKEKESIDFKIENFKNASKDLDRLLESQKLDKDMKGVGFNEYCVVPPPPAQVYSPPKKDLSWMYLPEFVDDNVTDYTRPTPSIDVSKV
nr:hypothetical protein [Tanacetum cinerariifolium]